MPAPKFYMKKDGICAHLLLAHQGWSRDFSLANTCSCSLFRLRFAFKEVISRKLVTDGDAGHLTVKKLYHHILKYFVMFCFCSSVNSFCGRNVQSLSRVVKMEPPKRVVKDTAFAFNSKYAQT